MIGDSHGDVSSAKILGGAVRRHPTADTGRAVRRLAYLLELHVRRGTPPAPAGAGGSRLTCRPGRAPGPMRSCPWPSSGRGRGPRRRRRALPCAAGGHPEVPRCRLPAARYTPRPGPGIRPEDAARRPRPKSVGRRKITVLVRFGSHDGSPVGGARQRGWPRSYGDRTAAGRDRPRDHVRERGDTMRADRRPAGDYGRGYLTPRRTARTGRRPPAASAGRAGWARAGRASRRAAPRGGATKSSSSTTRRQRGGSRAGRLAPNLLVRDRQASRPAGESSSRTSTVTASSSASGAGRRAQVTSGWGVATGGQPAGRIQRPGGRRRRSARSATYHRVAAAAPEPA